MIFRNCLREIWNMSFRFQCELLRPILAFWLRSFDICSNRPQGLFCKLGHAGDPQLGRTRVHIQHVRCARIKINARKCSQALHIEVLAYVGSRLQSRALVNTHNFSWHIQQYSMPLCAVEHIRRVALWGVKPYPKLRALAGQQQRAVGGRSGQTR